MNRGNEVTDFGGTGMLEIQKIDKLRIFSNDEEAVEQASKMVLRLFRLIRRS